MTTTDFNYNEPLPPMPNLGADPHHSWEPAARHYQDLTDDEKADQRVTSQRRSRAHGEAVDDA